MLLSPAAKRLAAETAGGWWLTSSERAGTNRFLAGQGDCAEIALAAGRLSSVLGAEAAPPPDGWSKTGMDAFLASFDDAAVLRTFERLAQGAGMSAHERLEAISGRSRSAPQPSGSA